MQTLHRPSPTLATERKTGASWLQVVSHLDPQFGGIASSVPQMCRATEAQGEYRCPIVGFCEPDELERLPQKLRSQVLHFPQQRMRWMFNASLRHRMKEVVRAAKGIHIHGIWETHCFVTAGMARSCKRPYIISAHGMLDDWALRHKRLKKALYAAWVETNNLQCATCLRALTRDEVSDYRRIGITAPVAVIPSGVEAPSGTTADLFWQSYPELVGKRIILFLGRLHPKKGLHLLMQAWRQVAQQYADTQLVIAGPDPEGMTASLQQMTTEFGLADSVTLAGMLSGDAKWAALAAASLFVLPSYSEGFSVAVLEALAMGIPVIVSGACHFPEVAENECGWVIQPEVVALENALRQYLELPRDAINGMGKRGRALAETRYSWPAVGKQMAEVHDWLLGGQKPASVELFF